MTADLTSGTARHGGRGPLLTSLTGIVAVIVGALAALGQALPAGAVDATGQFEMDGNIVQDAASAPPYNWASLFDANGNRLVTPDPVNGPLLASKFLADSATPDHSYFSSNGAGVKDIDTLSNWGCKTEATPTPKDDLQNAYAALIKIPANAPENANHTVLYLGSERLSNNGTSFAGFWLFKDKTVGCDSGGTGSFTGAHQVGDLLVVSDYTNGGTTQDVSVYKWVGGPNPLSLVVSGGVCPTPSTATGESACAIANTAIVTSPWAPTSHDINTFVEAGIDLDQLFAIEGGGSCFTTFMAETRSSNELTATLKDFTGGQLDTCLQPPIVTTATPGGGSNLPGTSQHDVATITGTPGKPAPSGTIAFTLCGPADVTPAGCPSGGTPVSSMGIVAGAAHSDNVTGLTSPNDLTPGKYCWRADYTPDAAGANNYLASTETNAGSECFSVIKASPNIATQIQVTGNGGLVNTSYNDQATLTNFSGSVATETITFNLFGPYAVGGPAPSCATGTNEPVFTTTGTLSAGGVATTSQSYTPTAAGVYVWEASYPGDTLNNKVSEPCNGTNETGTISPPVIKVNKTADAASVSAGASIGFTVTVQNTGVGTATGVNLSDALPGGNSGAPVHWVIDSGTGNPSAFSITGIDGSQQLILAGQPVSLGGGLSLSVHVTAATTATSCAQYDNTASATSGNDGSDQHSASTTVLCPSIHVNKTADAASVSAGTAIGFTVTISNTGSGNATGVTMSDALPGGNALHPVHWSIDSGTGNPTFFAISGTDGSQQLTLNGQPISLASGSSLIVHVTAATTGTSCTTYNNTASATAGNDGSDQHSASEQVLCPSIHVNKTADATSVSAGTAIGFTVTVSNTGAGNATGVTLTDALPGGNASTPVHWAIDSGTGNPSAFSISGVDGSQQLTLSGQPVGMAAGASLVVHVTAATSSTSCTKYDNTASVTTSNDGSDQHSASETVLCASVHVNKTADAASVSAGTAIGFTVTVSNTGAGNATGVTLTDALPGGNLGAPVHWTIDSGTGNPTFFAIGGADGSQQLTLNGQPISLASGGSLAVHVVAGTSSTSCTEYDNTASVATGNDGSDQHSASETVLCPSIHVNKTADAASVSSGTAIGFTVTVSNTGLGNATGVTLTDALPGGNAAHPVHWSIDSGTGNPSAFSISGVDGSQQLTLNGQPIVLNASSNLVVHVTAATSATSCTTYDNTASASAGNDGSDQHSASETVLCPSIDITKTADAGTVSAGQTIGYTVTVSNGGPGNATGVTLTDALPGGNTSTPVHWTIDTTTGNPGSFSVSGADGSQHLTLNGQPVSMAANSSLSVHLLAVTTPANCTVYDNSANAASSNGNSKGVGPVAITVQCPNLAIVKTAVPVGPVSTGSPIGFTVTVSNSNAEGTGTAFGVTVADPLPAGSGINWAISPAYGGPGTCTIGGAVGSQVLHCSLGDMLPGASVTVGIVSPTTATSAGHYTNTATAQASNNPPVSSTAGVIVLAPGLNIDKTADAASVIAGNSIGFTITVTNAGPGIAAAAHVNDPLPSAPGVSWSISPAYSGPGTCSITTASSGAQTLVCSLGDMAANTSASVHVTSATTTASCTTFPNTATGTASNQSPVSSSATTAVTCPISQVQGIISTPVTGAGVNLRDALGLIVGGLVLIVTGAGMRRRRRRNAR
ncbi:MAG TPA: hypothetical protein VN193_02325 [Candidatus Angelobacter sp.]|nr:hypothetical protein [Candidatus Angelobacter sp.]